MIRLQGTIGYKFQDEQLLQRAITHSSYANEKKSPEIKCNERLEFLGDSVLGFLVARYLFQADPDMPEGDLSRARAGLVCESSLEQVARSIQLGRYLRLGRGEETAGGRERPSILADATEALLGAIYLDGGIDEAAAFIRRFLLIKPNLKKNTLLSDYKTALQEYIQRDKDKTVSYRLVDETGPDHAKIFTCEVLVNDEVLGRGEGTSKKAAEQKAACAALVGLDQIEAPR